MGAIFNPDERRKVPVWVAVTERGLEVHADILIAVLLGDSQPPLELVQRVQVCILARIQSGKLSNGDAGWAEVEEAARRELVDAGATLPIVGLS